MSASSLFPADRPFVSPETYDAFFAVMERLDRVVEQETQAMRGHDHRGLAVFTRQKRQGLLELNRIMRTLEGAIPNGDIMARLAKFRTVLSDNDMALQVELDAARAVTGIIVGVMREMDSDGTYSRAFGRHGYDQ